MKKLDIIYKRTDELIPYVNNPRFNDGAVDAVASSIKNFGFKQPIVIDNKNEVVAGHTRLLASKKLGLKEVPVIIASDLSDPQIKAFRLADNKVGELARWDYSLLDTELDELEELGIDMAEFEFEKIDFDSLDEMFDYEHIEEEQEEPKLKRCPHCGGIID